jgi:benzylsuccinate CoA-transferase BbsE subunit
MLGYPVSTVADIASDPQLAARVLQTCWMRRSACGSYAVIDGERPPLRHAPAEPFALAAPQGRSAGGRP